MCQALYQTLYVLPLLVYKTNSSSYLCFDEKVEIHKTLTELASYTAT